MAVVAEVPRRVSKREGLSLSIRKCVCMYGRRSATVTSVGQSAQGAYSKWLVLRTQARDMKSTVGRAGSMMEWIGLYRASHNSIRVHRMWDSGSRVVRKKTIFRNSEGGRAKLQNLNAI